MSCSAAVAAYTTSHSMTFSAQTFEVTKLESNLRNEEMQAVNEILDDFEKRKRGLATDVGRDMRTKLAKAMTDQEREKIMMEYAGNLQKFTDALEKQKQQQLEDLRRRLLERRRQNKKELHKQQVRRRDVARHDSSSNSRYVVVALRAMIACIALKIDSRFL